MTSFIFALLIIIFIVHIMGCVNVSSKDFIKLARNGHVSKEALEVITHKYWIERGSEELFPTNVYIQAQLGNTEYIEKSKNVKELWQSDYSIPKTFGTFEEVKRAAEYAAKFFPKEAIEYYKDNKGDYVLSIRKPVSKFNRGAKGMLIITDAEGNRLPMMSQQEVEDYALITEQLLPKSEKNSKFAAEIKNAVENQDHISAFIENAIKSGKWNEYTVKVFNNLIKKIKDGQIDFKRTVGERFSFTEAISDIHAAASLITRGTYGAERKGQKNSKEQYERDAAQGKQQEKLIEAWAKASDLWLNDYEDAEGNKARTLEELLNSQWDYFDQGSESEVYRYDDTQFLKSISLSHTNDNIAKALDKIALFNHMFPETALNIVGFGRDSLGHFRIIALQNIIRGEELTNEELQEFNNKYKLKESKSTGWFESQDGVALLTDLSPMNIKKDAEGNYFVIDADVAFNTPEMGGNVMFQNSLEYSDTPLQFSINRRNTGPQTFTFNDGTTVSVPFKPNVQQEDALNVINDFIHSDETSMTLSGYAGTGKTSLMEIIANKMRREYRNIIFSATTNKAAAVLKERVSKAGFDAKTLNKVFGINVEVDSSKAYNARNLVTKVNEADIPYGTVVVIDEASMINEVNYDILNEIARKNGLKIIYVGDKAQLAPVNEKQISKVFRNTEGHIVELTQVERTDDNAILKEATNLRNGMPLSGESSFNNKGEGVAFMSAKSREDISKVINHYIQGLRNNPNFFRILAYTNKAITSYNDFVRKGLGYDDYVPRVGEPITGYANWGYDRAIKNYRFINSEAYTVTKVRKPQEVRITIDGQTHKMTAVPITIEDAMGNTDEVKFMDIRGNANNLRVARLLAEKKAELWNRWRRSGSPEARVELQRQINAIEEFLFVNDFIEDTTKTDKDGKHPILQKKVVDYGYAITIHKSQGSTFTHVLIDDIDIANHINKDNNPENAFVNVDLGEEGNRVTADTQQIGEEDVDLGDLGEIDTTPEINDEAVNIRQQLEYVGVSRATDTVTILSDNVKKEDSPLNHSLDSTEQREDTGLPQSMQKPTEQISSAEIWEYMGSLMPLTKRSQVEYTPQNQEKQIYSVEVGHIYNKEGKEVYPEGTIHRTHRNKILANNAVKEGLAVVVTHPDSKEKYVVDNNKQIISVRTGEIMKWGEEHGDRRKIIAQATQAFRDRINAIKERGSAYTEQLLDYLELIGLDVHNETEMAQYLKEHESNALQQAITGQQKMDGIQAMQTPEGEIRGFATPEGSLYFDRNVISPEHPIHEYTHLWDRVVAKNNPELWQRGVSLMKQISLWKTIEKDANYGEKWKTLKNMTEQKLESLIASEVHSRLTGRNSEQILDRLSKEKGQKSIVGRLKQWLLDFWKELKSTFSDWSKEDLDKLTLQEFTMMTVRDFADGFNPNAFKQESQQTKLLVTETSSDMSMNSSEASTIALEDTLNKTRDYYRWQRDHITFDEKTHTYYYDGRRVDYSVTEYKDEIYGKPNIQGDYSHSSAMGRSVDALTRDFFTKGKDPRSITYPNINNTRKQQILKDLERLKKHFDEEFNGVYRVITPEFKLAARINTPNGERTIAGTMDMLIIDGDGNLHILDMKVKNHPITQTYRGKEVNDRRDYTFQLNAYRQILEALYPEFTGKVKDLKLIWFDTKYPKQGKEATFSTDETGVVTVSDSQVKSAPLSEYTKWETPSLKESIDKSLIPLTQNNVLENVKAINENWRSERQSAVQPSSTRLPYTGIISITQNASGRLGTMDASDEAAFKSAKEVLRDSKASEEEIKDAVNTIDEIYDRKNAEMQSILEEVSKIADVSFAIEDAADSWLGGEEYSFKVKIEAKTQEDYDKAIQALSYVAEAARQDAFIENLGEVNEREVTAESLLNKEHTPFIHIPFTKKLSQQEIAVVQNIFSSNSTEEVPLDATVTEDEIVFSMPTWKLKDNPTEKEYKDFYTKWLNKIIETYNNGKERELKGLVREVHRRTYEKSRFHEAGNAYSEQSERNYSSFRDSYLSERGLSEESKGTLSEEEGQRIKETVEKLFKESSAPQEVNLPGYEYFNDLNENTKVDAAWKIPLLQELDGQLSNENTAEENTDILSQMDSILQAESQEEYEETRTRKKKEVEKTLSDFERLIQQINNLLDSSIISASEIRHTAELVVNSISDTISILQKEKGAAEKFFPALQSNIDFQSATRKEIVEAVGIDNLIHRAKEQFDPEMNDYEDYDTIDQADLLIDNWDAIVTLASDIFAMNEGFGIVRDYGKAKFTTTEKPQIDYDNFNDYSNDPDAMAEAEKDEQEHWQVEQRTIDVLNSMSQLVRLGIHECYQIDKNGEKVISKWGIAERVNPRLAVNSILRWTQGSLTLEDMVNKLSNKSAGNPWLNQLIERLSDQTGKETDFQSQFFGVFQKHFQPYSIVLLEDGKYHSIPVNSHPALSEAMQSITSKFKIGEHALFTKNSVNTKLLGSERTTGPKEEFNLHKALTDLLNIQNKINHGEELREELTTEAANNIMGVCRIMGYPVTEDMVSNALNNETLKSMTTSLNFIVKKLDSARDEHNRTVGTKQEKQYNPFKFGEDNSIDGELRKFLTPIVDQLEDTAVSAFYDSGKMYQSYITPSFMTKLMNKFRLEGKEFEDFIMNEYGSSEWFKASKNQWKVNQGWRNEWLKRLATDETARKVFDHKVELNFNKHNYMKNMSDAEYTLSLITEYFAEKAEEKQSMVPAWFRVPMLSNKPSSEFVKFLSYRGSKYKDEIVYGLHQMFNQELSRIQTVLMRNYSKSNPEFIKNFDTNGRKFNFLPVFNTFLDEKNNSELGKLLREKLSGKVLSSSEESRLSALVDETIYQEMENRVTKILDEWENSGILEAAENIEGIGKSKEQVRASVENFLWNDAFAAKNILQLTITDIAFYKDAEDLQKRLAQIHAPGIRANVAATDYGNPEKGIPAQRVSDGYYRTIVLKDFDGFKSNIIANISEVFDRKIAAAPENQKAQLIALKDSLVRAPKTNGENDKGGKYWNINVTDAQGYSSPSSYRKKAFMFGRWSQSAEDIYQKLLSNEYSYSDLETAFQPLKPFVYSHLQKEVGVENSPIQKMAVPFQAKNAEYLLIMADAILKGEELSRPNLLRAVYRIMENSAYDGRTYDENGNILNSGTYNGRGIDTVQFESAIKSGLQGTIDIGQFAELPGGENAAYEFMKEALYTKDAQGNLTNIYNTETHVHEAPFEDYCLQQEVPEHFKNHSQAHGSQIRMIIPSDLDAFNTQNEENKYEWIEPDGTKKSVTVSEFKNEYENTIADNIRESIDSLAAELHIYSTDKKERNIALSKILQREILSSPRYGIDLIQACSIDKKTGDFRIPKGDPIQSKRIEQLINSIIKNRVNKQKIAGGPIVQVSNFGTSKQLHIRFNAKSGGLLLMENEFTPTDQYKTYDEYKKAEQAGIAYFEVYVPIWNNELFDKFANEDGTIDTKAIEAVDPELLKMVSYRIPTEDKYSCAPMKVVGFMPREAGDAIMLPYELTEIDDSDFDVDKRYVMRKDIKIVENRNAIEKILIQKVSDSYAKAHDGKVDKKFIKDQVKMYMDNPDRMKDADKLMEAIHKQKQLIMKQYKDKVYKTIKPKSGKLYRDNKIIDMTWAVLTNEMTADKILNPGGFDNFKEIGYKAAAYKLHNGTISWEELDKMSIDELSDLCYIEKDLTWADTQIQFYKQNSAAASLIGVFAVNKVAHATLEGDGILIDVQEICGEKPFVIGSTKFGGFRDSSGRALMSEDEYKEWTKTIKGFKSKDMTYDEYVVLNRDPLQTNRMVVDAMYDTEGNFIGKTLGSGVSASADAAKTPVLNLLNINMTTVGTFTSLLRLGMPHEEACMFIGQDVIARTIDEFNRQNLTGYESLNSIIEKEIKRIQEKHGLEENSKINTEPITREEIIEGLTSKEHEVIDYKVLIAFQKAKALADSIRNLSYPTRFNSIASAVGPLIIDNLIMEHKIEQFTEGANESGTHFYDMNGDVIDINSVFDMHPVLSEFSRTVGIAATMFSDMPAGSTGFRNMLNTLPDGMKDKIYNDKKLLDSLSNFYQSYLLIASHLINPADLRKRIDEFPKYFNENKFTEKYPDNAFIQAIKTGVAKRTGRPFLSINITGVDEAQKEVYRNAWTDLHKENPELSKMLFEYCFFRAGIGFSPKTFMALVPTYVKERLTTKLKNGDKATYVDTYRKFPEVNFELIVDQWVRNNWDNNKLVPKKGSAEKDKDGKEKEGTKKSHYIIDINNGKLIARTPEDIAELANEKYIKTRQNNQTYLWKQTYADDHAVDYTLVTPLGNNGEYIEMSLSDIRKALNETKDTVEDLRESELKETSPAEADAETPNRKQLIGNNEQAKNIGELADLIMKQNPKLNRVDALNKVENIKKDPSPYLGFLVNVFKQKGLNLSQEEALKEFEKYC